VSAIRVLWLTPELPYWPGGSGGSTRQHQLIAQLAARGHEVHVVAPVHRTQRQGAALLEAAGATLHGVQRPGSRVGEVLAALRARPALALDALRMPLTAWQVEVFWTRLRPVARALLADPATRPDVLHVEHDWAARWVRDLPEAAGIPRVCGLENLSWAYHQRRAAAATGAARAFNAREARRFARFDRRHLPAYDLLLATSASERRALAQLTPAASAVVPNGVDTAALTAAPLAPGPVALFTGTFAYGPNSEGLAWLLREVWPRVTAQIPEARLLVVGRGVPGHLAALAGPEVRITGFVEHMQPWFDQARLVLVPIRSGGGTRLKVLDGLASGRPIVSTTIGAEGIDVRHGEEALIADDPAAFAAAAVRVLGDAALAERLGAAGRRLAERDYDWRPIGARLADLLEALAAGRPAAVP
jgi:glycosyltransferase involved in cell wall biosynthesis